MKRIFFLLTILSALCADAQIVNRFRDSTQFYGSVRMDSIVRITKGAAAGKVLTSDANGTATWSRTVNVDTNNIIFQDTISEIYFGIGAAPSGNHSFYAEHTDSIFTHYIINKLEGVACAISNDCDVNGLSSEYTATGDFVSNYTGVDNTTGEIIAGMIYSDATDVYEIRLDINGLRMQFNSTPIITIKPSGIINAPLPTYANDAAAGLAGLVAGDLYQTVTAGEGFVKIKQ